MKHRTTNRMTFRPIGKSDASFVRHLMGEPGYIRFVGDRDIKSDEDAVAYIEKGFTLDELGRGFYLAVSKENGEPLGFAGLICRAFLPFTDVGYAFMDRVCGQGLASEATGAALAFGFEDLGLEDIGAIISHDNAASIRVVEKQGLTYSHDETFPVTGKDLAFYSVTREKWMRR